MSSTLLEGMPVTPAQGNTYLGVDSRPQFLTDLSVDSAYQKAVSAALAQTASTTTSAATAISVPVNPQDLQDAMQAAQPRQLPPMQFASARVPYTVQQVEQAAIDSRVFGSGWVDTFRKDKPPQGIQYLRPVVNVPVDLQTTWNQPTVGPWNPINVNANVLQ